MRSHLLKQRLDSPDRSWYGMLAPANTPQAIVSRLYSEAQAAVRNPQASERMQALQLEPVRNSPAEFKVFIDDQLKRFAEMELAGVEPE